MNKRICQRCNKEYTTGKFDFKSLYCPKCKNIINYERTHKTLKCRECGNKFTVKAQGKFSDICFDCREKLIKENTSTCLLCNKEYDIRTSKSSCCCSNKHIGVCNCCGKEQEVSGIKEFDKIFDKKVYITNIDEGKIYVDKCHECRRYFNCKKCGKLVKTSTSRHNKLELCESCKKPNKEHCFLCDNEFLPHTGGQILCNKEHYFKCSKCNCYEKIEEAKRFTKKTIKSIREINNVFYIEFYEDILCKECSFKSCHTHLKVRLKIDNNIYKLRSYWEFLFALFLYDRNLPIEYESTIVQYVGKDNKIHKNKPDFKIGNKFFEVKGNYEVDKYKIEAVRKVLENSGVKLILVEKPKIEKIKNYLGKHNYNKEILSKIFEINRHKTDEVIDIKECFL